MGFKTFHKSGLEFLYYSIRSHSKSFQPASSPGRTNYSTQKGVAEEVVCMFAERTRRRCHPTSLCGPSPRVRICPRWASLAWIGGPRTRTRLTSRVGCCVHLPAPSKYCQQSSKIERQAVGTSLEGAKSVSKRRSLKRQKTHIQPTDVAVTSAGERLKLAEMFQETQ